VKRRAHIFILASVFLVGCSSTPLSGPPKVREGRDECSGCGMIISESRCSGALLLEKGGERTHRIFDDLGCMLDDEREELDGAVVVERYVRDYATTSWVPCDRATFVKCPRDRVRTPMGSGLIAFEDPRAAQDFAASVQGTLLKYAELAEMRAKKLNRNGS